VIPIFKPDTTLERIQEMRGRSSRFLGLFERASMAEVKKIVDAVGVHPNGPLRQGGGPRRRRQRVGGGGSWAAAESSAGFISAVLSLSDGSDQVYTETTKRRFRQAREKI
jgi:hypothetical protein